MAGTERRALACIVSFTDRGDQAAGRVAAALVGGWDCRLARAHGPADSPGRVGLAAWTKEAFAQADALVFVGALGIAVRAVAPLVASKASDPAVVVVDEGLTWAISVLSGHLGGANDLARAIAAATGAMPVITTATDLRGAWAADAWARQRGLAVANPGKIKAVSGKLLAEDIVSLWADEGVGLVGQPPAGVVLTDGPADADLVVSAKSASALARAGAQDPLRLVPACVGLGLGCRRGIASEALAQAVDEALERAGLSWLAVGCLDTIDLKAHEPALVSFCEERGWRLEAHSAEELAQVQGSVSSSDFVRQVTGVDNVCERAALVGGGRLVLPKLACGGVTVALALRPVSLEW